MKRDAQGRIILGDPRGCPDCGEVVSYLSEDGRAVVYRTPMDCCDARRAVVRRNPRRRR